MAKSRGNSAYFPTNDYQVERRDRHSDPHGGVFIAVKTDLALSREPSLETDCVLMWCKLHTLGCKILLVGAFYRPKVDDAISLNELEKSL